MPNTAFNICLPTKKIRGRNTTVLNMLEPVVTSRSDLFIRPIVKDNTFVLSAIHTSGGSQGMADYEGWRFPTYVSGISASYFERWIPVRRGDEYYLDRAYFHLYYVKMISKYIIPEDPPEEYCLLHCDPNEDGAHSIYKKSPHIHVEVAPAPWKKAHIALNVGYLEPMLESSDSLTRVFSEAILMLKKQILDELDKDDSPLYGE